jgi:hypothetical protein
MWRIICDAREKLRAERSARAKKNGTGGKS